MLKILLVDDDQGNLNTFKEFLTEEGHIVDDFLSPVAALEAYQPEKHQIVISDMKMPDMDGATLYENLKLKHPSVIFILITAYATVQTAVSLLKNGVFDYVLKPIDLSKIKTILKTAENCYRFGHSHLILDYEKDKIIGLHPNIISLKKTINQVSPTAASVLITGESGSGKELVAQTIHNKSNRKGKFISLNCGAIPPNLMESTLFGHESGAFTGAEHSTKGKIEAAENGTLFLDEIGELPLEMQVKLLRTISQRELEKVGSSQIIKINCRFIAATNRNLKKMVEEGTFRQDLYYRLNVIELNIPPLRERKEDIPILFSFFLSRLNKADNWCFRNIDIPTSGYLLEYPWPGNIRELKNCVESMTVLNNDGKLFKENLPDHIKNYFTTNENKTAPLLTMEELEMKAIEMTLNAVDNNRRRAAEILGISERTIYRRIGDKSEPE